MVFRVKEPVEDVAYRDRRDRDKMSYEEVRGWSALILAVNAVDKRRYESDHVHDHIHEIMTTAEGTGHYLLVAELF